MNISRVCVCVCVCVCVHLVEHLGLCLQHILRGLAQCVLVLGAAFGLFLQLLYEFCHPDLQLTN